MEQLLTELAANIPAIIAVAVSYGALRAEVHQLKSSQKEIKDDLKSIKNNHMAHVERDVNDLKVEFAVIREKILEHLSKRDTV